MAIYQLKGVVPSIAKDCFVAASADVIGAVQLAEQVSVWFAAVVRGDSDQICIGARSNVQDGAVLHADPGYPLNIGEDVTVGHKAVVHGCQIGDRCLVGIGATVLNGAVVGEGSVIGAGALVTEGMQIPPASMVLGVPAKVVRTLSPEQQRKLTAGAEIYVQKGRDYIEGLEKIDE